MIGSERSEDLTAGRGLIDAASRIVVLTGAGISTESGIPDFRGPQGVWTHDPQAEKMATIQHYVADPEVRKRAWQSRLHSPAWTAEPNAGHRALVVLERRGKLHTLITQNVDGLHAKAGSDPARDRGDPRDDARSGVPRLRRARADGARARARARGRGRPGVPLAAAAS